MLGKLIKYDLKSVSRLLIPLHVLLIAASFLGRFILTTDVYENIPFVMLGFAFASYIILMVVVSYVTIFLIIHRFYKNLFSDEGYLTWTLPITPEQHLLSKTISGSIWMLFDGFVMILSLGIFFLIPDITNQSDIILEEMSVALQMPASTFFTTTLVVGLISIPIGIVFYYFCIALGQLFSKHRVMAAILIYFVLSTILGIIMLLIMLAIGFLPLLSSADMMDSAAMATASGEFMLHTFYAEIVLMIIQGIISYMGTLFIMKKKLNLE